MTLGSHQKTFAVGDQVKPTPEWESDRCIVPSGRVRAVGNWGGGQVIYVDGDHRGFVGDVFELVAA